MSKSSREGLWDDSGLDLEPGWKFEPSLDAVKTVRLYVVEDNLKQKFIMRVSLPVDPHNKTASEVATLRWLRNHSDIPVPRVMAFDDSNNNEMGFEWILMQLMPGTSAYYQWRKLPMETKKALVENVAEYHAQLFSTSTFRTIGTLKDDGLTADPHCIPSRMVSQMFFWGPHFDYDIPRGPFRTSHDWLGSFISIILQDQAKEMNEAEDEDDEEDAEYNLRVAQKLADLLPKIFPRIQNPPERTVLWHDDLSLQNIMVDDKGAITAIIDWECVSAMPLWVATQMLKFLRGSNREQKPRREQYGDETPEEVAARQETDSGDGLDSEGKCELYWTHLMEYEQTQLRKVYSDHMSQIWGGWNEAVADGVLKVDFFGAVVRCADGFNLKRIEAWIDAINRGEFPRLADMLRTSRASKAGHQC
ncbi:hypothetical protein QQZ08_004643 [Neonectria magnoliae]|uniref:Aminoglycoside phosphotransferase domain-containing protein n=1 Tax=Neonectria magnoliae TaxID=2732573 RepID=A0ABR1I5N8_9HYPO